MDFNIGFLRSAVPSAVRTEMIILNSTMTVADKSCHFSCN